MKNFKKMNHHPWRNLAATLISSVIFYTIYKIINLEAMFAIGLATIIVSLGVIEENTDKDESKN